MNTLSSGSYSLLMLLGAVLSGCQSPARYSPQGSRRHLTPQQVAEHNARLAPSYVIAADRKIEILSEPPGARIEVNDDYVGDTPATISVPCTPDGRFTEATVICAMPTRPGDYMQTKVFSGGYVGYGLYTKRKKVSSDSFIRSDFGATCPFPCGLARWRLRPLAGFP